jgi:beta-glucanase (GH16 family)
VLGASCQSANLSETSTTVGASETTTTSTVPATTTTTIVLPEPVPIDVKDGWELVWNDEFDGDAIDQSNWTYDIGGWGWGNGEAQYYTSRPENASVENGLLVISLRQEKYENSYYTSARLKTQGLREFQYGRIEARMKVPRGAGTWPAFWMLGASFGRDADDPNASNWPQAGEIDVMEHVGRKPQITYGTVHGPGYAGAGSLGGWNTQDYDIADEFHTYAIEWDASGIEWFYDGEPFFDLGPDDVGNREWVFDQPFFLITNLALGGTFGGTIGLDIEFPLYLYVDHIRVYQKVG